jgi:hypothetical protein
MDGIRKKNLIPCSESIQPYQQLIVSQFTFSHQEFSSPASFGEEKTKKGSRVGRGNKTYAFLLNCVSHSTPVRVKKKTV